MYSHGKQQFANIYGIDLAPGGFSITHAVFLCVYPFREVRCDACALDFAHARASKLGPAQCANFSQGRIASRRARFKRSEIICSKVYFIIKWQCRARGSTRRTISNVG